MTLWLYKDTAFLPGTKCDRLDVLEGDGSQTEFVITQKPSSSMQGTVQVQNSVYRQSSNAVIKTPTGFILNSPPADGAIVVVPGTIRIQFRAYNQLVVAGRSNPNISIVEFYMVDPVHITAQQYEKALDEDAILLSFVDVDETYGGSAEWLQFGYADPETGDAPSTWLDAGEPFEIQDISWNSELTAAADALDTSIFVDNVDDLISDQTTIFLQIDPGVSGTQDEVQVASVNYGTGEITLVTPLTHAHADGAKVYLIGVKGYAKLTLPTDIDGPTNYFDIGLNAKLDEVSRIG